MEYTTLQELQTLKNVSEKSINSVVSVLNKSFNSKKINEDVFNKALGLLDDIVEKAAPGKYLRIDTPGQCKYFENTEEIQKAIDASKLTKKQIQVTNKHGKTYTTTRYVKTGTDESEKTGLKTKHKIEDFEGNDVAALEAIVNGDGPKSEKVRDLLELGIYDRKALLSLSDANPAQVYTEVKKLGLIGLTAPRASSGGTGEDMPDHDGNGFPPPGLSEMSDKKVHAILEKQRIKRREEEGATYKDFWQEYEDTLDGLINEGFPKSLIAYGTGGLGKTFTLDQVKERNEVREYDEEIDPDPDQYDAVTIKGTTGLRDMWSIITKNRDKMIIFDDADSMWGKGKEEQQNILKGMLDTSGDGTVRYGNAGKDPITGEQQPKQIKFKGTVVFISNLEETDFPQPLIASRCASIDLSMTKDETMDKLDEIKGYIKLFGKDDKEIEVPIESRNAAYEFFAEHQADLDIGRINGRTFAQVANLHRRATAEGKPETFNRRAMIRMKLI